MTFRTPVSGPAANGVIAIQTTTTTTIAAHGHRRLKWPPMTAAVIPRMTAITRAIPDAIRDDVDRSRTAARRARSGSERTRNIAKAETPWAPKAMMTTITWATTTQGYRSIGR